MTEIIKNSMDIFKNNIIIFVVIGLILAIVINVAIIKIRKKVADFKQQKYATAKGKEGENAVQSVLASFGKDYVAMKNILLPTKSGSTELDHVLVSIYGIFVIETKNYSGTVKGDEDSKKWLHYDRGGNERSFYSPIKQNQGHIGTLKRAINIDERSIFPIVVFAGSAELKINCKTKVIKLNQLESTIKSYNKVIFTKAEMKKIVKDIKSANMDSVMARSQHIKHVKSKQNGG